VTTRNALVALSDATQVERVVERLAGDGINVALVGDATVPGAALVVAPHERSTAVARVAKEFGSLDILVTDVVSPAPRRFTESDPADWFSAVHSALSLPFSLIRAAVHELTGGTDARIVVVGHGWASSDDEDSTASAAVQGAAVALVKTLARDLGSAGITVNEVTIPTDPASYAGAIASAVGYLVSPLAGATTGQILTAGSGGEIRP
jgi:NAD(P)-dependent dehydrogenase (short-subunit alcohol dehydrogenase family)